VATAIGSDERKTDGRHSRSRLLTSPFGRNGSRMAHAGAVAPHRIDGLSGGSPSVVCSGWSAPAYGVILAMVRLWMVDSPLLQLLGVVVPLQHQCDHPLGPAEWGSTLAVGGSPPHFECKLDMGESCELGSHQRMTGRLVRNLPPIVRSGLVRNPIFAHGRVHSARPLWHPIHCDRRVRGLSCGRGYPSIGHREGTVLAGIPAMTTGITQPA